jgi:hypothetical protein
MQTTRFPATVSFAIAMQVRLVSDTSAGRILQAATMGTLLGKAGLSKSCMWNGCGPCCTGWYFSVAPSPPSPPSEALASHPSSDKPMLSSLHRPSSSSSTPFNLTFLSRPGQGRRHAGESSVYVRRPAWSPSTRSRPGARGRPAAIGRLSAAGPGVRLRQSQ